MTELSTLAAALAIAGALMLALNTWWSAWAWPVWAISNVLWIAYAVQTSQHALAVQQLVFLATSLIGCWRWLLQPAADAFIERVEDLLGG